MLLWACWTPNISRNRFHYCVSANFAELKFDYFSKQHGEFGSSDYLGSDSITLADGFSANNQWLTRQLNAVVPAGAVEARGVIVFGQINDAGGAVHVDDVNFAIVPSVLLGDVNQDGVIGFLDIAPLIALLTSGDYQLEADVNEDSAVNFLDISPFILALTNQ